MVIPIKFDNVSRASWQRNLPKNVLHVQSFCFAWLIELASSVTVHAKQYLIRDDFVWKIDDFMENERRKRLLQVSIETESLSSANRPPRACFFFDYCYFCWDNQLEPLRRNDDNERQPRSQGSLMPVPMERMERESGRRENLGMRLERRPPSSEYHPRKSKHNKN